MGHGRLLFAAALFAHGFTLYLDAVSVVHQPVENAIGQSGIPNLLVPLRQGQLAGQDRGSYLIAIFADLQAISPLGVGERCHGTVVDQQHVSFGETGQQTAHAAVSVGQGQVAKQLGGPAVLGREASPAGFLGQRAGQETLADSTRSDQKHVLMLAYPTGVLGEGTH